MIKSGIFFILQLGPQLTYWMHYKNVLASLSANPNFSFGRLTRIPVIYAKMSEFKTPDQERFFKDFHVPVDVSGFGFGISAGLTYIFRSGILADLWLRYDFAEPETRDNSFVNPEMPNMQHFFLQAGFGFITKVES